MSDFYHTVKFGPTLPQPRFFNFVIISALSYRYQSYSRPAM